MAANSRAKATWVVGDVPTAAHFNTIDGNGGGAVARAGTSSGTKLMPICHSGSGPKTAAAPYVISAGRLALDNDTVGGNPTTHQFALTGLPHGHTLTAVTVKFDPAAGHIAEPANLPVFSVLKVIADGTVSTLGTSTYGWVDIATYEAGITETVSGLTEVIDAETYHYYVSISNESGADSVTGCVICSIACAVTVDTAEGGADFSFWV